MRSELLFCDDIRTEVSGQHTIVGVYQEGISTGSLPVIGRFYCWLRIFGLPIGFHSMDFSLSAPAPDDRKVGSKGDIEVSDENSPVTIVLGPYTVKISEPGALEGILQIDDEQAVSIGQIRVSLDE